MKQKYSFVQKYHFYRITKQSFQLLCAENASQFWSNLRRFVIIEQISIFCPDDQITVKPKLIQEALEKPVTTTKCTKLPKAPVHQNVISLMEVVTVIIIIMVIMDVTIVIISNDDGGIVNYDED